MIACSVAISSQAAFSLYFLPIHMSHSSMTSSSLPSSDDNINFFAGDEHRPSFTVIRLRYFWEHYPDTFSCTTTDDAVDEDLCIWERRRVRFAPWISREFHRYPSCDMSEDDVPDYTEFQSPAHSGRPHDEAHFGCQQCLWSAQPAVEEARLSTGTGCVVPGFFHRFVREVQVSLNPFRAERTGVNYFLGWEMHSIPHVCFCYVMDDGVAFRIPVVSESDSSSTSGTGWSSSSSWSSE